MSPQKKTVHGEEFLNVILDRLWPFLESYVNKDEIKNEVSKASKGYIALNSIKLGSPMKFHEASIPNQPWLLKDVKDPLVFDFETEFKNVNINVSETTLGFSFGVIASFKCNLRVQLQQLTSEFLPLFEALTFYFTEEPRMDLDFTNAVSMLDLPFVNGKPEEMAVGVINSLLVYPNRMTIPMKEHIDTSRLQSPLPIGLLVMQVTKIEKLHNTHEYWGKPEFFYKVLSCFGQFTSKTRTAQDVDGDTTWNEVVAVVVCEPDLESLEIKVYEDDAMADDYVGKVSFKKLSDLIFPSLVEGNDSASSKKEDKEREFQSVFDLIGDKTGKATILFEFHPLCSSVRGYARKTLTDQDSFDNPDKRSLTLQNSKTAEIQYYLKVYITKITQDDKSSSEKPLATNKATNTATGNDNPLASKTFYFECIENAFPQETEAYATDKNASFPASMATEVFLASVPNQLNFVFTTDRKALKQSAIAEFQISLSDEKAANNSSLPTRFEDEMQFEVDVKNVGSLTVVIHSGKLSKK